jgi:hypothetical protein
LAPDVQVIVSVDTASTLAASSPTVPKARSVAVIVQSLCTVADTRNVADRVAA